MAAEKKLTKYRAMRDFTKTAEPSGARKVAKAPHARFVVQKHRATRLHYDFRLEIDGAFHSWAVTRGPSLNPQDKRLAVEVEHHPLDYGDFEGTIPKGQYGGGTVMLWDRGYWAPEISDVSVEEQIRKGELKFVVAGQKLEGSFVLVRMKPRSGDKPGVNNWLLIKHRDQYASDEDVLAKDKSVASGRTMDQITAGKGKTPTPFMLAKEAFESDAVWQSKPREEKRAEREAKERAAKAKPAAAPKKTNATRKSSVAIPAFIEPQLAKLGHRPPGGAQWAHEIKFDGYRLQMRVENGEARLRTRKGLDWTAKFGAIAEAASALPDCIIDGEVCALDKKGVPHFDALQAALSAQNTDDLIFFAFDLLFSPEGDLRKLPLSVRKQALEVMLDEARASAVIRYVEHLTSDGAEVLEAAQRMGLEGVISKRLDAPYRSGRGDAWMKAKTRLGQEVVIGGWTENKRDFSALMVGIYRGDEFVYAGNVGTGFNARNLPELRKKLRALKRETSPFGGPNAPKRKGEMYWVKPELVAEIAFAGWTEAGSIRQGAFKALREDKPARDVRAEEAADAETKLAAPAAARAPSSQVVVAKGGAVVRGISISNVGKALWPDGGDGAPVTKGDLVNYLDTMSPWIMPYIQGRPCSFVRLPDGIHGRQRFFQRHGAKGQSPHFTLVKVDGDHEPYLQIDSAEALIAAGQAAALEFHPWNGAPRQVDLPGRLVFDLDPDTELGFGTVIAAAKDLRERLDALGLASFCKTTGGKGLHVVTPLAKDRKPLSWEEAKSFAYAVCAHMANDSPDKYLVNMSKAKRTGRIFLDYLRNDRTSTAVALLSPRAREGATVSMPIAWSQVRAGLDPKKFTIRTAPALMKKSDPWKDYEKAAGSLRAAATKLVKG